MLKSVASLTIVTFSLAGSTINTLAQPGTSSSTPTDMPSVCVVIDPTPAPLNVRAEPQGQVISTLSNGQLINVLHEANDAYGKRWAYVTNASSQPLGWVFREYLACK